MRAMMLLSALILVLVVASPVMAIDVAMPTDFFTFTANVPGDPGDNVYYLMDPRAFGLPEYDDQGYLLILDGDGNPVWFRRNYETPLADLRPIESTGGYVYNVGGANYPYYYNVLDDQFQVVDTIPGEHPNGEFTLDGHELLVMPDGSFWTLWHESRWYDMSQYIPGGQTNVEVVGSVVEHWDSNHNILWSWSSLDHLDMLPFDALHNPDPLYSDYFEHLHANSISVDGDDVYVSCRNTSFVIKIDQVTGDVIWRLGGGPVNDFTFTGDADIPLDFNYQHDAIFTTDGTLTLFDNGNAHNPSQSFAKEYLLNETEMTAELVWYQAQDPPSYATITGSHRKLINGNHMIGWGNVYPHTAASEVDSSGNTLWEVVFDLVPGTNIRPGTYRTVKTETFAGDFYPYLAWTRDGETVQLVCNWFGHEDDVFAYNIYAGVTSDQLTLIGSTDTGYFDTAAPFPAQPYYFQIVAVDIDGNEFGPPSEVVELQLAQSGIEVMPLASTVIPADGGTLVYFVEITSTLATTLPNVTFATGVVLPNGNTFGPLWSLQFVLPAYSQLSIGNLMQEVPAFAPPGQYSFVATVSKAGVTAQSSFEFEKLGTGESVQISSTKDWPSGKGEWPVELMAERHRQLTETANTEQPDNFSLEPVYPNPFNLRATVTVNLPEAGRLRVTVFDPLGREVAQLAKGQFGSGSHAFTVDAESFASGVYFIRAVNGANETQIRKMAVVK